MERSRRRLDVGARLAAVLLIAVLPAASAGAQVLPTTPLTFGDGRATVGGDVSATFAPVDTGYFNYTDYDRSLLRLLQVDIGGAVAANDHVSVLGVLRMQNTEPQAFALYVRVRPWKRRAIDILAGKIPPTFGSFARRAYTADNPLIGEPLAYQYLTSLRPDSLPASADELLRMRGRGWLSSYSLGDRTPAHGVPLVSAARYDSGVQVRAANEWFDAAAAVTVGTLANPLVRDDNGAKQIAARVAVHPVAWLVVGGSASRGGFASSDAAAAARSTPGALAQHAWGADAEYSRDHLLVRFEAIASNWTMPAVSTPLSARAASIEGRYKLRPGLYVAARYDHLGFSDITGPTAVAPWEAPVKRFEFGGGYMLQRNLVLKLAYQYNWRDGGRVRQLGLACVQLLYWL